MASGTLALLGDLSAVVFSRVHTTLYPTVSVHWLVGWSVGNAFVFLAFFGQLRITAPAQSHATDSAVYTALLFCNRPPFLLLL